MRTGQTGWGGLIAIAMGLLWANTAMANCTPADNARVDATGTRADALTARMKAGECSLLPEINHLLAIRRAIMRDSEGRSPKCWVRWRRLPTIARCKCRDVDHLYVCADAVDTAKVAPPAPQVPQAVPQSQFSSSSSDRKSASCSDITGTNSTAPAATDCKEGTNSLRAARITRKKFGLYAQEQYKKAAASFRLAGDIGGAEAAEREAKLSDEMFEAQQKDAERAIDARKQRSEAEQSEKYAERIEEGAFEDGSCADLEVAASYYRDAARAFLNAGVYDKASLDVQREDRLEKIIKKAQAEGRCDRKLSTADRKSLLPPHGGDELADDPNDCAGMRARLTPHAENKAWIDTQMTNSNCHLDGTPMTLRERLKAALDKANP